MQKRLNKIIAESGQTLVGISCKTGIPQPYFSMMLSGKRPISTANWIKILTKLEGLTRDEAQVRLAQWQIEDAQKILTKNHIVIHGSHNEVNLSEPQDDELLSEIRAMSSEDRALLKKLIKSLRKQ